VVDKFIFNALYSPKKMTIINAVSYNMASGGVSNILHDEITRMLILIRTFWAIASSEVFTWHKGANCLVSLNVLGSLNWNGIRRIELHSTFVRTEICSPA
jgi:hypothetical protein